MEKHALRAATPVRDSTGETDFGDAESADELGNRHGGKAIVSGETTALAACIVQFPVYRTYVGPAGASAADRAVIDRVVAAARADAPASDTPLLDFLRDLFTLDLVAPGHAGYSRTRARRFHPATPAQAPA